MALQELLDTVRTNRAEALDMAARAQRRVDADASAEREAWGWRCRAQALLEVLQDVPGTPEYAALLHEAAERGVEV